MNRRDIRDVLDDLCGKNRWKSYCITLDRATDRQEEFSRFADYIGVDFEFWKACDKLELTDELREQRSSGFSKQHRNDGEIATRLSHEYLIKNCLFNDNEDYFFIFEDDAGFKETEDKGRSLDQLLNFFDGITRLTHNGFGWHCVQFGFKDSVPGVRLKLDEGICQICRSELTHANLFSRSGLIHFYAYLNDFRYFDNTIDKMLDVARMNGSIISIGPPKSVIHQVDDKSYAWL